MTTVDAPPPPERTRLRRVRERTGRSLQKSWRRATWAAAGLRRAGAFVLVRVAWPTLIRAVQSTTWPVRWRELTDTMTGFGPQSIAVVWFLGWTWLAWHFSWPFLLWFTLPALPVLAFGVGRLAYPHIPRGLSRGRFHPESVADWPELRREMSTHAVRAKAAETRPAIAREATLPGAKKPSPWLLTKIPAPRCGTFCGYTAAGPPFRVATWTTHENGMLLVGGPRTIKTSTMTWQIADEKDRAVLSLQTKASTFHDTRGLRMQVGPVWLIDPENISGHARRKRRRGQRGGVLPLRWAPQLSSRRGEDGKLLPLTLNEASERAAGFSQTGPKLGEDGEWLASQLTLLLRAYLLIAGLAGKSMTDVYGWCTSLEAGQAAIDLMDDERYRKQVPAHWVKAAAGVLANKAERTVGAILLALHSAVGFMGDPEAAAICTPEEDDEPFDVEAFLRSRGTVYLIASDRPENKIGPLLSAFASFVVEESKRIAGPLERERLEPGLLLSGDESANTIPLDLPRLFADSGGRGIQVIASIQSRSQLRSRYGRDGADTVWNSAATKLFAGGITVDEDVESISRHAGFRKEWWNGKREDVPALKFDEVRRIPERHAALLHRGMRLTIVHLPAPWRRSDIQLGKVYARTHDAAQAVQRVITPAPPAAPVRALPAPEERQAA